MLESKKYLLESKFEDFQEELPKYAVDMFHKFLERSEDNEVINNIKDEMKNMFYKNRKHIIKNAKNISNTKKKITYVPAEDMDKLEEKLEIQKLTENKLENKLEKKPKKKKMDIPVNKITDTNDEIIEIVPKLILIEKKPKKKAPKTNQIIKAK
jgi:hypothetical protein